MSVVRHNSSLHSLSNLLCDDDHHMIYFKYKSILYRVPSQTLNTVLGARSETSGELTVRSNLVGNAGSRPISEAKQPWACPVLAWGTSGEAHVLYSLFSFDLIETSLRSA